MFNFSSVFMPLSIIFVMEDQKESTYLNNAFYDINLVLFD